MTAAEEITQNIRMAAIMQAREHIKQNFDEVLKDLNCKSCNTPSYFVKDFSDNDLTTIAHLKCNNCGSEGDFTIHLLPEKLDEGLISVKNNFEKLEKTIDEMNHRFNSK